MLNQFDARREVTTTTCQICGRPIKAKHGIIAHHGYTRPGNGWQTASCDGARHQPYEDARDRIPAAIKAAETFVAKRQAWLDDFLANPPAILIKTEQRYAGRYEFKTVTTELPRPADFNPTVERFYSTAYEVKYDSLKREAETQIKFAKEDIAFLTKRFNDWTPAWLPVDPLPPPF